jgi:hypothetical protein
LKQIVASAKIFTKKGDMTRTWYFQGEKSCFRPSFEGWRKRSPIPHGALREQILGNDKALWMFDLGFLCHDNKG